MRNHSEVAVDETRDRILVVDDEPQILKLIKRMLEISGYSVVAKDDSVEALETFGEAPYEFQAVLTDMCMPNMTGDQLSMKLMEIRPDIPIIMCTGYSELFSEEQAREAGLKGYLRKPVYHKQIVKALQEVIEPVK